MTEHTRARIPAKDLDTCAVLRVKHGDVPYGDVGDDVGFACVLYSIPREKYAKKRENQGTYLAETPYGNSVRAIAP